MSGAFDGMWTDVTAVLHWHVETAAAAAAASPLSPHAPLTVCTASLRPALVRPPPPLPSPRLSESCHVHRPAPGLPALRPGIASGLPPPPCAPDNRPRS